MKFRVILAGLGAGILFTLPYTSSLLSPDHLTIYHSQLPIRSVADALLLDFAVLAIIGAFIAAYLARSRKSELHPAWILIGVCVALVAVAVITSLLQQPDQHRYLIRAGWATLIIAALCRWRWPGVYRGYARALIVLFLLMGISAIWVLPELGWLALANPHPPADSGFLPAASGTKQRRIVWVLFDELSYDQTFDHRSPSVKMPVFDKLARSSVVFSDLQPAGYYTELAIPSFFLGDVVEGLKSNMEGIPSLKLAGKSGWHSFNAEKTVFGDARREGWSTGVVGWYNPYCRTLEGVLDSCYSVVNDLEPNGMSPENSVFKNAVLPVDARLGKLVHVRERALAAAHESDYVHVMRHAQALIADENIRFVFIHLPIPHPPGIYDRKTGKLQAGGDYLDNLALADRTLGELLGALSRTASANRTTLVICSDHSWRVPMWKKWVGWTAEEQAASKGIFDPRPVLIVHFPKEASGQVVSQPFREVRLHDILLGMIDGSITSKRALIGWITGGRAPAGIQPSLADVARR